MVHSPNTNPAPSNVVSWQQFILGLVTTFFAGTTLSLFVMLANQNGNRDSDTKGDGSGNSIIGDVNHSFNDIINNFQIERIDPVLNPLVIFNDDSKEGLQEEVNFENYFFQSLNALPSHEARYIAANKTWLL